MKKFESVCVCVCVCDLDRVVVTLDWLKYGIVIVKIEL